jgi:hypothetical protein
MVPFLEEMLGPASDRDIVPYCRLTLHFAYPTGATGATEYSRQRLFAPLDAGGRAALLQDLMRRDDEPVSALPTIEIPIGVTVPSVAAIKDLPDVNRSLFLIPSNTSADVEWHIALAGGTNLEKLRFVLTTDRLTLLVWSEKTTPETWAGNVGSTSGTILVLYIIIVLCVGLVVRNFTTGQGDALWINRVEAPERLYEQVLSIYAYQAAGDPEKEALLAKEFLATVRSREKFLSVTAKHVE